MVATTVGGSDLGRRRSFWLAPNLVYGLAAAAICVADSSTLAFWRPLPTHQDEARVNVAAS